VGSCPALSDIWSQASYKYPISWEAFLNPSDSYFLFADFVDFYTHYKGMVLHNVLKFEKIWLSHTLNIIRKPKKSLFPKRKGATTHEYPISWEAFLDPSDSYFLFADFVDFYTH
jgi:hypothetical protein